MFARSRPRFGPSVLLTTAPHSIIDMIIVPAIAYDRNGNRIGRGKGYYDRLLQKASALKIGVGYDFQLIPHIDSEPHDIPVDIIVTPNNFINCRKK